MLVLHQALNEGFDCAKAPGLSRSRTPHLGLDGALGSLMLVSSDTGTPKISIEWEELYTK